MKLKIKRIYTKNLDSPYENIEFKTITSLLKNKDGSSVGASSEVIVPGHWSQIACDILVRNYFRKNGVPNKVQKFAEEGVYEWAQRSIATSDAEYGKENDARKLFDRLAGAWVYWGIKGNYFESEEDAKVFFDEMRYMLAMQMAAPNSPQWFNTGVHWAYGITGEPQGHYYFDEADQILKSSTSAYERPQPHACFIQSVSDDLVNEGGIMDLWIREARLFKYGSGTGSNFSNVRGSGEKLSGGGISSGLMSFLRIGDVAGGSIKSGGTTRRAAKMVIVDIDHPDIETFINWKWKEEEKVLDFIVGAQVMKKHTDEIVEKFENKIALKNIVDEAIKDNVPEKYIVRLLSLLRNGGTIEKEKHELNWDSPLYANIFGQNSNNSVRVDNKFLQAVEEDADYNLINRTNGQTFKTLKAQNLWKQIAQASWACADPGLQFDTTINEWNTCSAKERINASNPCSEYMFLDDTACNLASLNLISFATKSGFDVQSFSHAAFLWTIVLEISIYMAQFPSKAIAQRSYEYRTLGLGYGNLGALLMQNGLAYSSKEGQSTAAAITALMHGVSYKTSALLAKNMGAFVKFEENRTQMLDVIENHAKAALGKSDYKNLAINPMKFEKDKCIFKNVVEEIESIWPQVISDGKKYGFRNAQTTLIAPTGTIGLIMDFKTTGVEPQFSQVAIKQLTGGGVLKIVNDDISKALVKLGYSQQEIEDISKYVVGHGNITNAPNINSAWLAKNGFIQEEIKKINNALPQSFNLSSVFSKAVLGNEFFDRLNIGNGVDVLVFLGASDVQIEEANLYACGHMTIEGAPHLKQEHLHIFDCAVPSGSGVRSLS